LALRPAEQVEETGTFGGNMLKRLALPALLLMPLAGCVVHEHHPYAREEYVTYDVGVAEPAPPPVPSEEVIIERERVEHPHAVYVRGYWEIDRAHHRWVWRRGYWR
jgi:hypothetical protein